MVCTFVAAEEVLDPLVPDLLDDQLETLAQQADELIFYNGYETQFDRMAAFAVVRLRRKHPEKKIVNLLVNQSDKPHFGSRLKVFFDEIVILPESECRRITGIYRRDMLASRDEWMVDQADVVVACMTRMEGQAIFPFRRAREAEKSRGLRIFNLLEMPDETPPVRRRRKPPFDD